MSVRHFGFGDKNCAKKTGTDNVTSSKSSVFRRPHEYATVSLKKKTLERVFEKLRFHRIRVDDSRIHNKNVALSNEMLENAYV